ncbi:MAG: glycosyltransferase [Candidatus Kerfeldbacteria bacterium]|nr:glycosyltransferase [Candidatus Kerfeldbacteria bacterium]
MKGLKLALVHEHLAQDGGAEEVARVLMGMYPDAPLYTLIYDPRHANSFFAGKDIRTSFLQRAPFGVRRYKWYLTFMPTAVEHYNLLSYDVVLSSASAFAKGVITRPDAVHICYCHSPTRYLWSDTYDYVAALPYPKIVKAFITKHLTSLRQWDRLAADRVDYFIANSATVRDRIAKYYRRSSTVIHPPVDTERLAIASTVGDFYLAGGRLVAYKRIDLAVRAFNRLGIPLKIFGTGPEEKRLRAMAKPNIQFLGKLPPVELYRLYSQALAFINPQEEDFGITVVESMAAGRPVIAYAKGGACETVVPGKTGVLVDEQAWEPFADAVIRFKPSDYSPHEVKAWAENFSTQRFIERLGAFVAEHSTKFAAPVP